MSTINHQTRLFCIFGHPVHHSLSPLMHNFAFRATGLNCLYLMFDVIDIKKAVDAFRTLNFSGASITVPHKIEVMKYLDQIDPLARAIGACNTIIRKDYKLIGFNTDWYGAIHPLQQMFGSKLKDKQVVLLGAGGAARAIAFGLQKESVRFVVLNRNQEKAKILAKQTGAVNHNTLDSFKEYRDFDIVINATSLGLTGENADKTPINTHYLSSNQLIFDIVYKPKKTKLLKAAKEKGAKIIYGYQMLLYQAEMQFKLFANHDFPTADVEKIIINSL